MLTVLFSHSLTANEKKEYLKKEHGMRMTREVKGGIEEMCNLSFAIREEGIEQGRKEGVEQGRKEGVEQGRKEGVEQGHREGFKQGCKEGIQQGIDKIKQLVKCLNEANHSDLVPKLFSDDAFLKEMMQKYNIG